jgi:putative transcriptional regulator
LRWGLEGRAKRGRATIIHFFYSTRLPVFLLTAFAKNERTDLSLTDRKHLSKTHEGASGHVRESTIMSRAANSIRKGLEEAVEYAKGRTSRKDYRVHVSEHVDVKAIRTKLRMTQQAFAARFGFSINTLRHWEQGKREPEGPTRAYLLVIDRAPHAVQKALRIA